MKNLILVALILLLKILICETTDEFEFGSILAVDRFKICECGKPMYQHFALFIGNEPFDGKEPGQNIIHFTGPSKTEAKPIFGKLEDDKGKFYLYNYLDGKEEIRTKEEMKQQIILLRNNYEKYKLLSNNCETLATSIRYKVPHFQQQGSLAKYVCQALQVLTRGRRETPISLPIEYEAVSCDELCPVKSDRKSG